MSSNILGTVSFENSDVIESSNNFKEVFITEGARCVWIPINYEDLRFDVSNSMKLNY